MIGPNKQKKILGIRFEDQVETLGLRPFAICGTGFSGVTCRVGQVFKVTYLVVSLNSAGRVHYDPPHYPAFGLVLRVGVGRMIELYHGDCLEILPTLGPVDVVVTDPPYNEVNRETGGLRDIDKGMADSATVDIPALPQAFVGIARETIYVFCGTEQVSEWRRRFVNLGLTTRLCVWEKTNPSPMNGDRLWLSSIECCIFARKPKATFNGNCLSPVWRGPTRPLESTHPTNKPVWLIEHLVRTTSKPTHTILDPFMGSGTTGVACVNLDRDFIGIEIDEHYYNVAKARIEQAQRDKAERDRQMEFKI